MNISLTILGILIILYGVWLSYKGQCASAALLFILDMVIFQIIGGIVNIIKIFPTSVLGIIIALTICFIIGFFISKLLYAIGKKVMSHVLMITIYLIIFVFMSLFLIQMYEGVLNMCMKPFINFSVNYYNID